MTLPPMDANPLPGYSFGADRTLGIPKFNPDDYGGGELTKILVEYSYDLDLWGGALNLGEKSCTVFTWSFFADFFHLVLPDMEQVLLGEVNTFPQGLGPLQPGSGSTVDCRNDSAPSSNPDVECFTYQDSGSGSFSPTALDGWIGTDKVDLDIVTVGNYDPNGCSNILFLGRSELRITAQVTYTYLVNHAPCCADVCDTQYVNEDYATGIDIDIRNINCVTDYEGDDIDYDSVVIVNQGGYPLHGTASHLGAGIIHYTPTEPNYCGPDKVFFTVADEWGNVSATPCEIPITINPVNDRPIAYGDKDYDPGAATGLEILSLSTGYYSRLNNGTPISLDVCANDYDVDGFGDCGLALNCDTIEYLPGSIVCDPPLKNGQVSVIRVGDRFEVTFADPNYCGECKFQYRVSDRPLVPSNPAQWLWSNYAEVWLEVWTDNNAPDAYDDDYPCTGNGNSPVFEDGGPFPLNVAANDVDTDVKPCGNPLDYSSIEVISGPYHGTVTVPGSPTNPSAPGYVNYTPDPNYCGDDTFTYRIWDTADRDMYGDLYSDTATVTICVEPRNDPPTAVIDAAKTFMDTPIVIDVCENDFDIDEEYNPACGYPLDCTTVMVTSQPVCEGGATGATADDSAADGSVLFTPPPGYTGTCTFTYKVFDTNGRVSADATVTVTVSEPECDTANRRNPGSLLLYPEFDNRDGFTTILTVTNSSQVQSTDVRFTYRSEEDCVPFARIEELTPNDTLTLMTSYHNPSQVRGYAYVTALCPESNDPIAFNHLTGALIVLDGFEGVAYSVNAVSFEGIGDGAAGQACNGSLLTDLDGDGLRDLDGLEYAQAPDQILIPRFLGQGEVISSSLVLIDLTGGGDFNTTVDFLIYNDNEEEFSTQYTFRCWEKPALLDITSLFSQAYLANGTAHDPAEVLGASSMESGWFTIDGAHANSSSTEIEDPAIYAVLIEGNNPDRRVADLPFELCVQDNGALLPNGPSGDQD